LRGSTSATLNVVKGFAHVNVTLTLTATVRGIVRLPNGQTSAGSGVKLDLYAAGNFTNSLRTTFSDPAGAYEFDDVPPGVYTVEANGADGNRGRATVTVTTAGQATPNPADVTFLGRGSVAGTVLNANSQPVPSAQLTFASTSIFGSTTITRS